MSQILKIFDQHIADARLEQELLATIPMRSTLDQTASLLEFLSHCDHPQFTGPKIRPTVARYIGLLLFTGIRREEAARLEWSDIDLGGGTFILHDTKNELDFVVPMSIPVHGVLTAQQAEPLLPLDDPLRPLKDALHDILPSGKVTSKALGTTIPKFHGRWMDGYQLQAAAKQGQSKKGAKLWRLVKK